jgi:CheY-like chemotaxis protein
VAAAIEAKVSDFLLKPFRPDELERRIQAALGGQRLAPPGARRAASCAQRQTVLVVDDTPANLTLVGGLLRRLSGQAGCARRQGPAAVRQQCARSVLLDLMMPEMDGFKCRRLRPIRLPRIFVIFLTAVSDASRRWKGWRWAPSMRQQAYRTDDSESARGHGPCTARDRENLRAQFDLALENARLRRGGTHHPPRPA